MRNRFAAFIGFAALALLGGITGGVFAQPIQSTLNYFSSGSDWEVGGVLNVRPGGALENNGVVTNLARGVTSVTGTADVTTGLNTVVACSATLAADPSVNTLLASTTIPTQTGGTAGHVTVKAWAPTATGNVTPVASSTATNIAWTCVGT